MPFNVLEYLFLYKRNLEICFRNVYSKTSFLKCKRLRLVEVWIQFRTLATGLFSSECDPNPGNGVDCTPNLIQFVRSICRWTRGSDESRITTSPRSWGWWDTANTRRPDSQQSKQNNYFAIFCRRPTAKRSSNYLSCCSCFCSGHFVNLLMGCTWRYTSGGVLLV